MSETEQAPYGSPERACTYKTRGTGPVLLMLQGGAGDADGSDALASHLADRYTVVTYDRRGLFRSPLDDAAGPSGTETHSDDAHRILAALTREPAFIFGSSLGALVGLDLVSTHPGQVRLLVAHGAPAAHRYQLNIAALKAGAAKIVPAAGLTSRDAFPHRCGASLARELGRDLENYPEVTPATCSAHVPSPRPSTTPWPATTPWPRPVGNSRQHDHN